MAWLKSMLKLESAFRAPKRLVHSAARLGKHAPPVFEIRSPPGKGLGVFATETIPRDAVIMHDPLVFQFEEDENFVERYRRFTMLPDTTQQNILKPTVQQSVEKYRAAAARFNHYLGYKEPEESLVKFLHFQDILSSNSFRIHMFGSKSSRGLYLNACRINHSCIPNADQIIEGEKLLLANREIAAGEEITFSYTLNLALRAARRRPLSLLGHAFICQCPACDASHPFSRPHELRLKTFLRACDDLDMDVASGELMPGKGRSYKALERAADRAKRRIEMVNEHRTLWRLSPVMYQGAFNIALAKYKQRWDRSDLADAIRFFDLFIKADKLEDENRGYIMWQNELYNRLLREYHEGTEL